MKVTGLDAVYATVKDIDGMTTFCTGLLGAPPNDRWPDRLSEWTFEDGNAFGLYKTDQADGSSGMPMFAVADVRAAMKEAQALGATFDEHEFTDTPVCHMAFGGRPRRQSIYSAYAQKLEQLSATYVKFVRLRE